MGKFNEIQEQTTQSWGGNSFTTTIKDNTVEFDSAKDKFTFKDPVEVPSINVGGTESVPFSSDDKAKLDSLQTPMQIKGRVDSVSDLPTEDVSVGDTYLVGLSGSETFDEYVCTGFAGSPEEPVWESVGSTQVQADWNQNDSTKADYIKNRICYEAEENIIGEELVFNSTGKIEGSDSNGYYWFNPAFPFISGETYKAQIGEEIVEFTVYGAPDNSAGSGGGTFSAGGFGVGWDVNGLPNSPNGEKAYVSPSGNPTVVSGNTFEILQKNVHKIDAKYIYQADWNQNDSEAADYIKNRICYEEKEQLWQDQTFQIGEYTFETVTIYSDTQLIQRDELTSMQSVNNNDIYFVTVDRTFYAGDNFSDTIQIWSKTDQSNSVGGMSVMGSYLVDTQKWRYDISGGGNPQYVANVIFEIFKTVKKTIDEKFIPDTIARVADLPQSDWNQTNSSAADYIKNKPSIPAAQVNSDWSETNILSIKYVKNKPYIVSKGGASGAANPSFNFGVASLASDIQDGSTITFSTVRNDVVNEAVCVFDTGTTVTSVNIAISDGSTIVWKDGSSLSNLSPNSRYIVRLEYFPMGVAGYEKFYGSIEKYNA